MKSNVTFLSLFWGVIVVCCGLLLSIPLTDLQAYRAMKSSLSLCYENAKGSPEAIKKCAELEKPQ